VIDLNNKGYQILILAALLHDIGKFIQRAKKKPGEKRHQEWGYQWLEGMNMHKDIVDAARYHHKLKEEDRKYSELSVDAMGITNNWLIFEADNLASGERLQKKEETSWDSLIPLLSIFSRITLPDRENRQAENNDCWRYIPLQGFDPQQILFPSKREEVKVNQGIYEALWSEFEKEFKKSKDHLTPEILLNLLERFTSFVPSETLVEKDKPETDPDISLFDHIKSTAAIANAIYNYFTDSVETQEEKIKRWVAVSEQEITDRKDLRYLLVAGDISGVQKFIYTITSEGALKGLRARSFYLGLLTEHIVARIIKSLNLTRANIVYAGGGSFFILAQNTDKAKTALDGIRREVNRWLLEEHNGRLFLALDWVEFCGNVFITDPETLYAQICPCENWAEKGQICKVCRNIWQEKGRNLNMADIWQEAGKILAKRKSQRFIEEIEEKKYEFFGPFEPKYEVCEICKKEIDKKGLCSVCNSLQNLGEKLPQMHYLKQSEKEIKDTTQIKIENTWYQFFPERPQINEDEILYALNPKGNEYNVISLYTGNYPNEPRDFEGLSKASIGAKKIGTLRMDVDNLGRIFTCGLKDHKLRTFTRIATLSRFFSYFFKVYLNQICKYPMFSLNGKNNSRNAVIVYSGGDDLFITGAWSDIPEIAFDIRDAFKKYTCKNPDINISGGMVVCDHKFPLYKMAELAGKAEDTAKKNKDEKGRKDSLTLFYISTEKGKQALKWHEWEELNEEILWPLIRLGSFEEDRFSSKLPRGFIYNMFMVSSIWQKEGILYLPKLAYIIKRSENKEVLENVDWIILKQNLMNTRFIERVRLAMTWLDLLVRGGEEK